MDRRGTARFEITWLAVLLASLATLLTGCGIGVATDPDLAESEPEETASAADDQLPGIDDRVGLLQRLAKRGQFEEFIDGALNAAAGQPDSGPLESLKAEALLGAGRSADAELAALGAAEKLLAAEDPAAAIHALRLYAIARFRQQLALDEPRFDELLARLAGDDPNVRLLAFWRNELAGNTVCDVTTETEGLTRVPTSTASLGSIPAELVAIEAQVGAVAAPMVFIDTGAQHTLITKALAREAGVKVGDSVTALVGFAGLTARPGVVERLEIGSLVLRHVPVLVGDSAPLVALRGQMALGTELMHHVRFTIDYPAGRVVVEPAAQRSFARRGERAAWEIPVWTFSQACLARGELPGGGMARVLVDTGNRSGTFVSSRWARRYVPGFHRAPGPIVFRHWARHLNIEQLQLGNRELSHWPLTDVVKRDLERLDVVDLLVGHDLVANYRLTIDLAQRVLQLNESEGAASDE